MPGLLRRSIVLPLAALLVALALWIGGSARPAQAGTCGEGCFEEAHAWTIYYTDASETEILCEENFCTDVGTCAPGERSAYFTYAPGCCC
jgi:hypothetical protein